MIEDDDDLRLWVRNAYEHGGGFLSSLARAAVMADPFQYEAIRPVLLQIREMYPLYANEQRPAGYPGGE